MSDALSHEQIEGMLQVAKQASANAYCKYSEFPVGAALLLRSGTLVPGCNVENVSYGLTNCAERTAVFSAVAQGYSKDDMLGLLFYMPGQRLYSPCGACRQVIGEFLDASAEVVATNDTEAVKRWRVADLLPDAFEF